MDLGRLAPASEVTGHSGSRLDIIIFLNYFFRLIINFNLSEDIFEKNKIFFP
jgi:hypothetical protein